MLEPPEDVLLLLPQPLRREDRVGFGVRLGSHVVQERDELDVARTARVAVGQMFSRRRIERLAAAVREIALDETVVVQVVGTSDHDFAPRSARSFRAARNRWTRTVDSLRPVIALTSRGVQSP